MLCASPAYLREQGQPDSVAGLARHSCLQLVTSLFPRDRWHLDGPNGRETFGLPPTAFQVNLADALAAALRKGKGVGALPMSSAGAALRSGSLVRALPGCQLQKLTVYVLYPSRQYLDAKIWTFVEFLQEVVPQALVADQVALNY